MLRALRFWRVPFETMLDGVTFDNYEVFRTESTARTDFTPIPQMK